MLAEKGVVLFCCFEEGCADTSGGAGSLKIRMGKRKKTLHFTLYTNTINPVQLHKQYLI